MFATCYGSPGVMRSRGGRMKSARFRKPVMTAFAQKKHSDFAPFVIEARQEVWYAVYGSIAEEGTSPSSSKQLWRGSRTHAVAVLNRLRKAPS